MFAPIEHSPGIRPIGPPCPGWLSASVCRTRFDAKTPQLWFRATIVSKIMRLERSLRYRRALPVDSQRHSSRSSAIALKLLDDRSEIYNVVLLAATLLWEMWLPRRRAAAQG